MDHLQEEVVVDDGTWIENGIRTEMKGQIDRERSWGLELSWFVVQEVGN